jgi:hypothetical protein
VKLDQSRFDQVGLAFSVTVVLFVKAFRFLQRPMEEFVHYANLIFVSKLA